MFLTLSANLKRFNAKLFISNRTNDEITRILQRDSKHVKHLHLDTSRSRKDVKMYLRHNLESLVEKWALVWKQWPGEERFRRLCDQADGSFIWAVTVVKFVRGQLERHGLERRDKVLDIFNENGMGDLNTLYGTILTMTFESDAEYERFRWIVGFIIGLKEPVTIGNLSGLLALPDSEPVDVLHVVTNLRMVLVGGTESVGNDTIPRLDKTFIEYVTSEWADPQFRIDVSIIDGQIATKCLRLVARLRNDGEVDVLPAGSVRYATRNWTRHLPGDAESGVGIIGGGGGEGLWKVLSTTATLGEGFMSVSGDYQTHMYDPRIGLPPSPMVTPQYIHRSTILGSTIPGLFGQPIAVSPDGKLIALGGNLQVVDSRSLVPIWKPAKEASVRSVCFSPDSRWLVTGGSTIQMWDCGTGEAIGPPLSSDDDWAEFVFTDGRRIISVSDKGTISSWSCDLHQPIGTPIQTSFGLTGAALSKNGHIALILGKIRILDIETLQEIVSIDDDNTSPLMGVAFSPDGGRIASGSWEGIIYIWDVQTGEQTHKIDGHTDVVSSVAFSPDGYWIASASCDKTVRVWNSQTGQQAGLPLRGHTEPVHFNTFSTDDGQIISGSTDGTIRIWAPLYKWPEVSQRITGIHLSHYPAASLDDRISLQGHPSVVSACYAPDRSLYAASTSDGHVSIWKGDRKLLWQTNTSIHPIHHLRLSETQLTLSTPNGSTSSWNLNNGQTTHKEPQLEPINLGRSNDISWFPFGLDAGLWAYVDGLFIRFEGDERSVTILDVGELSG